MVFSLLYSKCIQSFPCQLLPALIFTGSVCLRPRNDSIPVDFCDRFFFLFFFFQLDLNKCVTMQDFLNYLEVDFILIYAFNFNRFFFVFLIQQNQILQSVLNLFFSKFGDGGRTLVAD